MYPPKFPTNGLLEPTIPGRPIVPAPKPAMPAPTIPAPQPLRLHTGSEVLSPEARCQLLSKAKQHHAQIHTKINLLEQEHRTREESKKPSSETAIYAAMEGMCANTRLVSRCLSQKRDNLEQLTMLTNRVEEYLTNSLRESVKDSGLPRSAERSLAEMDGELQRMRAEHAALSRLLQSATDRLAEEAAEADSQATLAASLRKSLTEASSELEAVRERAARDGLELEQLREANHRLNAEVQFAREERQTLTHNLRQMVDTLAEENGRLRASLDRGRAEPSEPRAMNGDSGAVAFHEGRSQAL